MQLTHKNVIDIALVLIFYAGYQGGKYWFSNRFQEIGIALAMTMFLYAAVRLATSKQRISREGLSKPTIRWAWWFWTTPLLVFYLMVSPSLSFSLIEGSAFAPSFFGTREFLILFLAPAIYFIYKTGYPIERIERMFVLGLILIVFNYLFHYFRIDLPSAYFSSGYTSYLVTYDEWRGYRLKPPLIALVIITLYTLIRLVQKDRILKKIGWIILFCVIAYIWFLVKARSQMATVVLAVLLYPLFFSRPKRINFFILISPLAFFVLLTLGGVILEKFTQAEGAEVRASSYLIAIENIQKYPFFGYGQSSAYSKTYQDIFGKKFFPTDLGIIGITFKYGGIGAAIYVFYNLFILIRLMKVNWYYRFRHGRHNPVLWSLFVLFIAVSINLFLNPVLAMMQGLTSAAFALGLGACYLEEYKQENRVNHNRTTRKQC